MRQTIFVIDIVMGLLLICIMICSFGGCTNEQMEKASRIADGINTVVGPAAVAAGSLGVPVWIILILNVLSSAAGAVVASLPKKAKK